jgi:hypothetical protein
MRWAAGLAMAALAITAAAPAEAGGRRHHRHHDGIDGGDIVAGAVVIGGIAALASAIDSGNREKQDRAVDFCSQEAEAREGGRVSDILRVSKRRGYYTVEGVLDLGDDGRGEGRVGFSCTVRNGSLYAFRTHADSF